MFKIKSYLQYVNNLKMGKKIFYITNLSPLNLNLVKNPALAVNK